MKAQLLDLSARFTHLFYIRMSIMPGEPPGAQMLLPLACRGRPSPLVCVTATGHCAGAPVPPCGVLVQEVGGEGVG